MNDLNAAIENLYLEFSQVPVPDQIDGCPCCIDDKGIETLLSTPLRAISSHDISSYASSAFLTVGEVSDYLYFLPRILELSIQDESIWPSIEVTGRAIRSSGISMKDCRSRALIAVITRFIEHLADTENYGRIDEWMSATALMDFDVKPLLALIEKEPNAVLGFWEENADSLNDGKLANAFWVTPNQGYDEILSWFGSDKIIKVLGADGNKGQPLLRI